MKLSVACVTPLLHDSRNVGLHIDISWEIGISFLSLYGTCHAGIKKSLDCKRLIQAYFELLQE